MSILTSLLHANYKENLMTRFSAIKQNRFKMPVYIYSCCHGNDTYISLTIKNPKFALLTCSFPCLVTKGVRVLEKNTSETQVSKTVFSHLKDISLHEPPFQASSSPLPRTRIRPVATACTASFLIFPILMESATDFFAPKSYLKTFFLDRVEYNLGSNYASNFIIT